MLSTPCCRFDRTDCERYSNDETIRDANQNSIPEELSGVVEYKVHGSFLSREGARSFPDTFVFSTRELKDAGVPKAKIRRAMDKYHAELMERGDAAMDAVSSDDEDAEPDERREGGGQGGAAIGADGGVLPESIVASLPETNIVDAACCLLCWVSAKKVQIRLITIVIEGYI